MLDEMFKSMGADCILLADDVNGMIRELSTGDKASRKSIEPITRLRKTIEELKTVEETDPNVQFIYDKLSDIFGE